jgi:hypothetical protein
VVVDQDRATTPDPQIRELPALPKALVEVEAIKNGTAISYDLTDVVDIGWEEVFVGAGRRLQVDASFNRPRPPKS